MPQKKIHGMTITNRSILYVGMMGDYLMKDMI